MCLVCVIYLLMPLMAGPAELPPEISAANLDVNSRIAVAIDVAQEYEPAWKADIEAKLADKPKYARRVVNAIYQAAQAGGMDPAMLWSVAYTESRGRHLDNRGRVKRGGAGEIGLMQIKPFWQRALKREYGLEVDLYNLEDNLLASTYILKRGGEDPRVMLSYYNTGQRIRSTSYQRRVMRYLKKLG